MKPRLKEQVLREWRRGAVDAPRMEQKSVGAVLQKVLPKLGLEQQVQQNRLVTDWPKVVGDFWARHTRPVSLVNGILTIGVKHSTYLSELSREPLLLKKIRAYLGARTVREIRFRNEG